MMRPLILALSAVFMLAASSLSAFHAPTVNGFIPNDGQWPSEVLYLHRTSNMHAWVTRTGLVIDQFAIQGNQRTGHVIKLTWENVGALTPISVVEEQPAGTTVSYFHGRSAAQHHAGLQVQKSLRFDDLYPGIDLIYYIDESGRLRYDFDVAPGAMVDRMGFTVRGDEGMEIRPDAVLLKTSMGGVNMTDLYAYVLGQRSLETQAVFTATSNGVAFRVPQWSGDVPLRVDPVVYGTFVGGDDDDAVVAVRHVSDGVIVAGWSTSIAFPTDVGGYTSNALGARDSYVAKFSKDLKHVLAYTFYGGAKDDALTAMDVDANGRIYITGETVSDDLPTTVGAVGQFYKSEVDGFIAVFEADLNTLKISTYFGGNKDDNPMAIAASNDGSVFVSGGTYSNASFPTTLAHQAIHGGQQDAFLLRLSATGGSFVFCTYYGKAGNEAFRALALDNSGAPFVTGSTTSSDFETAPQPGRWSSGRVPYDRSYNDGLSDAFLIKFFADGTLSKRDDGTFATFFGGNGEEEGRGIYIDNLGRPTLVGITNSPNLPTTGSMQTTTLGGTDIFMAVFTDDGRGLQSCTYFGGTGDDDVLGMVADPFRNGQVIFGTTRSLDFPVMGTGVDQERKGTSDAFMASITPNSNNYATLIGGVGEDAIISASSDANGDWYFVMEGNSPDLFTQPTSWMTERPGGMSGYVGKWADGNIALSAPGGGERWCKGTTRTIAWSTVAMRDADRYRVEYTVDDGETWTELAKDLKTSSYQWVIPMGMSTQEDYRVRVISNRGHESWSKDFTLAEPPTIIEQPQAVDACEGISATLTILADGDDLRYQWRFKGQNIAGATEGTYVIPTVSAATAGNYDCVVSGVCQPGVTSAAIKVTSNPVTAITQQPNDVSVKAGEKITLAVTASGLALTYQWRKDGQNIDGATAATYVINSAMVGDEGTYHCVIDGTCGAVTSESATVQVDGNVSVNEDERVDLALQVLGPIPASSDVRIRLSSPMSGTASIRIVDGQGAVAASFDARMIDAGVTDLEIPVSDLASGSYGLEVQVAGRVLRTMLLIAR